MAEEHRVSWQDLFVAGDMSDPAVVAHFKVVRRSARPFLVLPEDSKLASQALALYAAQTPKARMAKSALALGLKSGLPLGLEGCSLAIEHEEPFAAFLTQCAGSRHFPQFAILLGNPAAEGARFVFLLFDDHRRPAAVVKAGMGDAAIDLIEDEAHFLASVPAGVTGVPRLKSSFRSPTLHAFAMEFVHGNAPDLEDEEGVERLLTGWVDAKREVTLGEMFPWQMLEAADSEAPLPGRAVWAAIHDLKCRPVLFHGDFAPWNIKVTDQGWLALDWERGELAGVPGWDWFHYFIQGAVLVRHEPVAALATRVAQLLAGEAFRRYAAKTKIAGFERKLLLAYLGYAVGVLGQSEGMDSVRNLLIMLAAEWQGTGATS